MVPRWWGTSERRSRRLEGKLGSLLKGEQSFFSPHRLWPETARPESSPLVQVFSRLGKERDGDSLSSSTSFFLLESISHSAHILDKPYGWMLRVTLVHPKWQIIVAHPLRVPPVSLWVGLFLRRPRGFWAGRLLGDGGDLGGFGPTARSSRGI